jgi:hypothetical protein
MAQDVKSKALQRFLDDLRAAHGDNLASVTLYGSTAVNQMDAQSDHNVLIVLRRIAFEDLRLSIAPLRTWTQAGQPMPVCFSVNELQSAADVFPIEFLQMEKARKILYGSDPFEFVEISKANLRHQTEYELRAKFLQLRRLYLSRSRSAHQLVQLMADSLSSFAALFWAALALQKQEAPVAKKDAVRAAVERFGLDASPFERILELGAASKPSLTEREANDLFAAYLTQLERVIDAVDKID